MADNTFLQGLQVGSNLFEQAARNQQAKQLFPLQLAAKTLELQNQQNLVTLNTQAKAGLAEISQVLADGQAKGTLGEPSTKANLLKIGAQFPTITGSREFQFALEMADKAKESRVAAEALTQADVAKIPLQSITVDNSGRVQRTFRKGDELEGFTTFQKDIIGLENRLGRPISAEEYKDYFDTYRRVKSAASAAGEWFEKMEAKALFERKTALEKKLIEEPTNIDALREHRSVREQIQAIRSQRGSTAVPEESVAPITGSLEPLAPGKFRYVPK